MAGKLFNIYSGNTGGVLSTSTTKVGSFGTTSDDFYSVNFDTGRKSIWTNNIEFGRAADWGNISGIPSWIGSDGVTWANVKDKPATATRWPYWSEILSKPAAIGSATQPVYWDGSTFQLVNSVAPASHDHDDRYLKLTGGTLSGDLAFSHGSSSTDQHITWASGTNYQRLKVRDGQTDIFIFQYSTDSGTTWSDYFTIQNGTAKIGTYTVYHSGNLPAYPTVNNGTLNLQASGTTKVTFTANQSGTSNFNIDTGSANGTISVGGTDVAVKGLGSNAYTSTDYLPLAGGQMTGNITWKNSTALPEQSSPQYFLVIDAFADGGATKWSSKANTLNALTGLTSTAKGTSSKPIYWDGTKFVECLAYSQASVNYANSAGSVDWSNVQNKPSTFTPSAHDHTRILYIDDRDTVETPTDVAGKNGIEIHFKNKSKSGITSDGTWTAIVMLDGYSDVSGGYPMELGFSMSDLSDSRPLYLRTPKSSTEWGDWRTILDSKTYTDFTVKKDGTGASGTWGISITGNAGSADKLKTARTITINGSSKSFDGTGNISWSLADLNLPSNEHNHDDRYLKLSGGTMTGVLHLLSDQYADTAGTGALDLANSDIYGVNSIKFSDLADSAGEGLQWYRDATHVDSIWVKNGVIYFSPNRTWGGSVTNNTVYHSGNLTAATLLGSTAKGNTTKPIYWDGSKLVECIAYSQASVNYATSAGSANYAGYTTGTDTGNWDANNPGNYQYLWFYGQGGGVSNKPSDSSYGSVINFFSNGVNASLNFQLYGSINHNSSSVSHGIWWRGKNNLGWDENWHRLYDDNYHPSADSATSAGYATSAGSADYATSAGNADTLDTFHAADLFQTFTNDATNNAVKIKIGNTEKSLVVGYATKANTANSSEGSEYLNNYATNNPNTGAIKDNKVKWFAQINSSSGYAGNNYGFSVSNNANGILYLGTHHGKYGHQLGFSSNGNIYHRYQNGADFPNTANGGSWEVILTSTNSSVSKSGETLSVKINGTTQSLTNTWRGITDSYNVDSPDSSISLSQKGAKALYSALINGYANEAGNADTATRALYQGRDSFIQSPKGGTFTTSNSTYTGYLRIKLPCGLINTMMSFFVDIYYYSLSCSVTYKIAGYSYSGGWVNTTAQCVSSYEGSCKDLSVRFGTLDSKAAIEIGEADTSWSYPQVLIRDLVIGYSGGTVANYFDAWTIDFNTTSITVSTYGGDQTHSYHANVGLKAKYAVTAGTASTANSVAWSNITGKATSKTAWGQTFVDSSGNIQSISGNMTSVGQVTPDGNATRDNGTSSANWATVYSYALRSNDNLILRSGTSKDIIFQTNAGTEYMRLTSAGKLGIGTNNPSEVLHVNGNVKANKFHSDANSSTDLTHIPDDTEIALETGNGNGGVSAWIWREKYASSNWGVFHNNSTDYLHVVGSSTSRVAINLGNGNVGIGTTSPSEKLHISGGLLAITNNSGTLTIGAGNGSFYHFSGSDSKTFYFSNQSTFNGTVYPYVSLSYNLGSSSYYWNNVYANKFIKKDSSSAYVLTGDGGHKKWNASYEADTIVARDANGYINVKYIYSDIDDESIATIGSVYVRNNTDEYIRRVSLSHFASKLDAEDTVKIEKTLTVTEAWMDTGIVMNTDIFPKGTGTYVVQIYSNTAGSDGYYPYYSGIMSIYTAGTNGSLEDEVALHCTGHSNNRDDKRIYIRTVEQANSNGKIQIAAASTISSHTYTFKFRKLI